MWHFSHQDFKDNLFAKQLIFSLHWSGKRVFPDFATCWHFNDKIGQKYLLEAINAPLVGSYVFYTRRDANKWIEETSFPKVFKLRGGAGSENVMLVRDKSQAKRIVAKAFRIGFRTYRPYSNLKEHWRKFKVDQSDFKEIIKGLIRFLYLPEFSIMNPYDRGYVYFQDFMPGNDFDIRVIVIGDKAFAIKRLARKGDFIASESGNILYSKKEIDESLVEVAFNVSERLRSQCLAFDLVFDMNYEPVILEISYGFTPYSYDACEGFWDRRLNWHAGPFNPYGWMVDIVEGKKRQNEIMPTGNNS